MGSCLPLPKPLEPFQVPGHGRGSGSLGHKNQSPHKVSVKETSPVVLGTLPSQSGGPGFHLWSGKWIPPASAKTQNSQINKNIFLKNVSINSSPGSPGLGPEEGLPLMLVHLPTF